MKCSTFNKKVAVFQIFPQTQKFQFQNIGILKMAPDMQHFINPLEEDLEMKQHIIIIFSVNQLTKIKTILCQSYKTNRKYTRHIFITLKYFILSRGQEGRECEDLGSYPYFSVVVIFQNIQLIYSKVICTMAAYYHDFYSAKDY